jgi:hypothetical protein
MTKEELWREFSTLPPQAQKAVAEFMQYIHNAYQHIQPGTSQEVKVTGIPFVGMWHNRKDLDDSSTWVRQIRQREWRIKA